MLGELNEAGKPKISISKYSIEFNDFAIQTRPHWIPYLRLLGRPYILLHMRRSAVGLAWIQYYFENLMIKKVFTQIRWYCRKSSYRLVGTRLWRFYVYFSFAFIVQHIVYICHTCCFLCTIRSSGKIVRINRPDTVYSQMWNVKKCVKCWKRKVTNDKRKSDTNLISTSTTNNNPKQHSNINKNTKYKRKKIPVKTITNQIEPFKSTNWQ